MHRSKGSTEEQGGRVKWTNKYVKPQGTNCVSQGVEETDETDTEEVMFTLCKVDVLDILTEEPFAETLKVHKTDM